VEATGSPWLALVAGLVFCGVGVTGLVFIHPITRFFHNAGTGLFGPRIGDRVYTARNFRWAFVPAAVAGVIIVVVQVVRLATE
jgi:hypothetical protein